MLKTKNLLVIACGLILCTCSFAQETKTRSAPLGTAVMETLGAAKTAGGIEVSLGCGELPQVTFQITTGDPDKSLQSIAKPDGVSLAWSKRATAYSVVISEKGMSPQVPSILVPKKVIEAASLDGAVDTLLHDPLVRGQFANLHFEELPHHFGFTSILEGKSRSITISAGRLDDALNTIAQSFGPVVWKITERICGEKKAFGIQWVVR